MRLRGIKSVFVGFIPRSLVLGSILYNFGLLNKQRAFATYLRHRPLHGHLWRKYTQLLIWIDIKPRRLPRNFSNIIVGVVYHPPSANDNTMKEYLLSSLESLESKFSNCAIILAGDFNRTLLPFLERAFRPFLLNPVVTFPTRRDRTLDQIFTNISSLYTYPSRLPPFGLSDHHSVLIEANVRDKNLKP